VRAAHHDLKNGQCPNDKTYFQFALTSSDELLAVELRRLLQKGYAPEQITNVLSVLREP